MTQIIKYYIIEGSIVIGAIIASLIWPSHVTIAESCTIAALLLGPAIAIRLAKYLEDKREQRQRKWSIFRTLLLRRKSPISPEFEAAFNLIEIEFHDKKNVMTAWKKLHDAFSEPLLHEPTKPNKPLSDSKAEQEKYNVEQTNYLIALAKHKEEVEKSFNKRNDLRANLIAELCKSLFGDLELYKDGYRPQGLADEEAVEEIRRHALTDVLLGNRSIRVRFDPNTPEDYSPKGLG